MIRGTPEGGFNTDTADRTGARTDVPAPGAGQGQQEPQDQQALQRGRGPAPGGQAAPPQPPTMATVQHGLHAGMQYPVYPGMNAAMPYTAYLWTAPAPGMLPPPSEVAAGQSAPSTAMHTVPLFRPTDPAEFAFDRQIEVDSDDSDADEDASGTSGLHRASYTGVALNQLTELKIDVMKPRELAELGNALPVNETITRITLDPDYPQAVRTTLQALHDNHTVQALRIFGTLEHCAPDLLAELTALLEKKTPLQQLELELWDWDGDERKFDLDQAFFSALFSHPHLSSFKLLTCRLDTVSLHDPQQLAARVRDNTSLKQLHFNRCGATPVLLKAIAPGLAGNGSLQVLDLHESELGGCGPALASVLASNQAIVALNLQGSYGWHPDELEMVIGAVADNTALQELYFHRIRQDGEQRPALGATIGAVLKANQHLQALSIHSKLDVANITLIQQGLHANTSPRFFDPGNIVAEDNSAGTTDATDALNQLFATNSRLTAAKLRPPRLGSLPPSANVLKGLERSLSIRSVSLWEADGVDELISLLNNNPRITELNLTRFLPANASEASLAGTLERIADQIQGNTTLLTCRFEFKDRNRLSQPLVVKALARFDALTARNRKLEAERQQQRQRIAAPALGLQMLSSFRHNDDANWPALNDETATAIASAIDTVLPQAEAQRVLDVLRFADIREAQPAKASDGGH